MIDKIQVIQGDITLVNVDVVVNAANSGLLGGGGVDGAIHRAAGSGLIEECKEIINRQGLCPPGQAVITGSGNMKCRKIIHTVGPIWRGGQNDEETILRYTYRNSMQLATLNKLKTIAFPNISTGVYGFPKELAAEIAIDEVCNFLENCRLLDGIVFVCFDQENYSIYEGIL